MILRADVIQREMLPAEGLALATIKRAGAELLTP